MVSKTASTTIPIKKVNDDFVLNLNRSLYGDDIIQKAISEDGDWVEETSNSTEEYITLKFQTTDSEDVLNWVNYLIYLHKD